MRGDLGNSRDTAVATKIEMMDAAESVPPLADLQEAILDDDQLRDLLSDISTYGKVLGLSVKSSPRGRPETISRLPELYLKLVQRRVFGAQVRYEFDGSTWLDTLLATPTGVRLVRVELPQ